jgi:hypothetical protein
MIAFRVSCGFDITLKLEDKENVSKGRVLECALQNVKDVKVFLHVRNSVPWRGFMEEPGFHIRGYPKDPKIRKKYDIYLTKKIFEKLTNPQPPLHPVVDGGYYVSRSLYDRVDIKYFAL